MHTTRTSRGCLRGAYEHPSPEVWKHKDSYLTPTKNSKCKGCGCGHTTVSDHRVRRTIIDQTLLPLMVGKSEGFWSSDVDSVKGSQLGVALEGILLNKHMMT